MRITRRLRKLDRDAFDAVATAHLPGLEYVLPRLSRTADYSVLWFGTAALLGLTRRPRLHRAALRGMAGIGVASPAVNLAGKHAFRRKRPIIDPVPRVRLRWKVPTSHAFPSGHSASAAAFAVGVAMEAPPVIALPVAGVASVVGFSRVYNGAHYPGDVLAGVVIGVLAGMATRLVWRTGPHVSPAARTVGEPYAPAAAEDGWGIAAVFPACR